MNQRNERSLLIYKYSTIVLWFCLTKVQPTAFKQQLLISFYSRNRETLILELFFPPLCMLNWSQATISKLTSQRHFCSIPIAFVLGGFCKEYISRQKLCRDLRLREHNRDRKCGVILHKILADIKLISTGQVQLTH